MSIDYKKYPDNWKLLRHKILERAGNRCELCFVYNYSWGYRELSGKFILVTDKNRDEAIIELKAFNDYKNINNLIKIILTIHHIDSDINNNHDKNLIALCQRCHLRLDEPLKRNKKNEKVSG